MGAGGNGVNRVAGSDEGDDGTANIRVVPHLLRHEER